MLAVDVRNSLFDRTLIGSERPDVVIYAVYSYQFTYHGDPFGMSALQSRSLEPVNSEFGDIGDRDSTQ